MLTPAELARMLHVDAKTVSRWCRTGNLEAMKTPGGHRRVPLAAVLALLGDMGFTDQAAIDAGTPHQLTRMWNARCHERLLDTAAYHLAEVDRRPASDHRHRKPSSPTARTRATSPRAQRSNASDGLRICLNALEESR